MDFSKIDGSVRFCPFLIEGSTRHFICRYREYCCSQQCCASNAFTFYQLWYFWLLLLLIILVCSGSGWWFRWRQAGNQLQQSPLPGPSHLRRRGAAARRGVYPGYHDPHPLDADPPSYREVMRRLSDFPQATTYAASTRGNPDMGWVTAPPPSYETIHDLRNQQKKLDRDIRNAERNIGEAVQSDSELYQETLRRGASARTRQSLSAKERIRALLSRVIPYSRYNNHNVVPIPKEPTRSETQPPPPYMISTHHHFHQQPFAWSVDSPSMAVHPSFRPPPEYNVNHHIASAPHYPMMYSTPYVAYSSYNYPMMHNDVDEWSRVDHQPHTGIITASRSQAARPDLTIIPGEYHQPEREHAALPQISQPLTSPGSVISSSNSRISCIPNTQAPAPAEITLSNQINSAGSSNQDGETRNKPASPSSRPEVVEQNSSTDLGSTSQESEPTTSNRNGIDYYTEFVSTSAHRFATRPVSSTTFPTSGRTGRTNLPGSASESSLQEDAELPIENLTSTTSNGSQVLGLVHRAPQPNPKESSTESADSLEMEESTSDCYSRVDLPATHQQTRSGAVSIEMDQLNSPPSDATTNLDSTNQENQRSESSPAHS